MIKVASDSQLSEALGRGRPIKLTRNIRLTRGLSVTTDQVVDIDFSGHALLAQDLVGNGNAVRVCNAPRVILRRLTVRDFGCNGAAVKLEHCGQVLVTDGVLTRCRFRGPLWEGKQRARIDGHMVIGSCGLAGSAVSACVDIKAYDCATASANEVVNYLCCSAASVMTGEFHNCGCIMKNQSSYLAGCKGAVSVLSEFLIVGRPAVSWNSADDLLPGNLLYASQPGDRLYVGPGRLVGHMGTTPLVHCAPGAAECVRVWEGVQWADADSSNYVHELGSGRWMAR